MKKIASKLGIWWVIIGVFPVCIIAPLIMRAINIDDSISIIVAAALLTIQCFGAYVFLFYTEYVIGIKTPEPKKKCNRCKK